MHATVATCTSVSMPIADKHSLMASPQFFSLVVLTCLLSIYVSCSSFEDHGINVLSPPESQKVNLSLYYETLCPYCADFIANDLIKVFEGDLLSIVNLRLVPYGNAQMEGPNTTIVCQHGPDECYLNSIEACAINTWPDVKKHFNFIHCVENQTTEGGQSRENAWTSCCQKLGMSQKPVSDCYNSGYERKLILQYADETDHLKPPHLYVPWVVVNQQPLQDDFKNFVSYVCKAYQGNPKPKACTSLPPKIDSAGNANSSQQGCYKGEERKGQIKLHK